MSNTHQFFITCAKGFEDLLKQELEQLSIENVELKHSGVSFSGELEQAYKVCLWSRLASRVLLQLKQFAAASDDALYKGIQTINWPQHLDMQGTLAVNCTLNRSAISNSHYAALKTKDAIVDQFNELYETRPSVEKERPDIRVNVHIDHDIAEVSIDLSGEPLHKRGYRLSAVQAPLKESLAAAILKRCGWPETATNLLDPMCGSATFLIEAAQMCLNLAPGIKRKYYGFINWKGHQSELWNSLVQEAKQLSRSIDELSIRFIGYDASRDAVAAAKQNVHSAGLQDLITIEQKDFNQSCQAIQDDSHPFAHQPGMVIVNPPYGERLGEKRELEHLYSEMGECWREHFPDWRIALFTANDELVKHIGLRAHRSNSFYNGAIKCKLHQYQIRPALPEEKRIERDEKYNEQRNAILNRLKKNAKHLQRWAKKNNITAYRLYDADIPEYSAAIDVYGDWVHVQEYQAPSTIELNRARFRFDLLIGVIPEVLGIDKSHIIVKTRRQQKGLAQYEKLGEEKHVFVIEEHGLKFQVNLSDFLDTGLFLDHRTTRAMVYDRVRSADKPVRFLNLFSYTSSVSLYAAAAGAQTTSVDMSNTYIDWSKRNFRQNNLLTDQHQFIKADCMQWLIKAIDNQLQFDLIFIDPPTFSNSKSMEQVFDVQKDHQQLIELAMKLLAKDGEIIFSNNFRRFKLSDQVRETFEVEDITAKTIPEDFKRNQKIHHCFIIRPRAKAAAG